MNFISAFNQFLSVIITSLFSLFLSVTQPALPQIVPAQPSIVASISAQVATPAKELKNTSTTSAVVDFPNTPSAPQVPWGTTEKVGTHEYRTFVANDPAMGTPDDILAALNVYRHNHNIGQVRSDENICKLAQSRAQVQQQGSTLDGHQGLIDYMNDPAHWKDLDIRAIGENASCGYVLSGTHLIEWVFDSDAEHRDNQLNPNWNLACAGVSGTTVDIIFGQR